MGLFFKTPEEKAAKKALKEERSRLYVAKTQAKIARTKLRAQKATVRRRRRGGRNAARRCEGCLPRRANRRKGPYHRGEDPAHPL